MKQSMLKSTNESSDDDVKRKIDKLIKFFEETGIDYEKFDPESIPKLDLDRKAFPNHESYMHVPGQRDTKKWLQAVREIYNMENAGSNRTDAIRRITSGWDVMETFDFLNWLRFYEAGEHMKYKFAQMWYENGDPGYFLHVKPDPVKEEVIVGGRDVDFARTDVATSNEKKQTIERQRNKIIARLDSAEKLLRSPDGHLFSGKEFEALLEAVYQLKKKINLVNKVSTSTKLYDDMIVREANILHRSGFVKAADTLYSIAQTPAAVGQAATGDPNAAVSLPPAASAPAPITPQGSPGGLPSTGPGMPQGAPSSAAPESVENANSPGISEFLESMRDADRSAADDLLEVEDNSIDVSDADGELMVSEAQAAPEGMPAAKPVAPMPAAPSVSKDEPLEVSEDDIKPAAVPAAVPVAATPGSFSKKIDSAFADVTIADVIEEFEFISNFFKARDIPRRLSRADEMLNALSIASFFPSLAEAQNKALDSNNYISSRVDEILSKLRGSIKGSGMQVDTENQTVSPEVVGLKNKLKSDEDKEKARKQMRKEQENAEADQLAEEPKETPNVEIEEDLGEPKPAAPPAAPPPAPAPPK